MVGGNSSPPRRDPIGRLPVAESWRSRWPSATDEGDPAIRVSAGRVRGATTKWPVSRRVPLPVDPFDEPWSTIMTEEQQKAQHALQEAMDRRDNGGETGH